MVRKMWFPPPSPNTKNHKFANLRFAQLRSAAFSVQPANEMHEKGDRGGGMERNQVRTSGNVWLVFLLRPHLQATYFSNYFSHPQSFF